MRVETPLTFVFDSRDDVIHEIVDGQTADSVEGYECLRCGRIMVRVFTPKLTPFSAASYRKVPAGVEVDSEVVWGKDGAHDLPPPVCPGEGAEMVRITPHRPPA